MDRYKSKINESDVLISDGIVSPKDYINSKIKVMFLNRESNDADEEYDLCDEIAKSAEPLKTCRNFRESIKYDLALSSCLMRDDFMTMTFEQFKEVVEQFEGDKLNDAIKASAFCNIKKVGGGGQVDWDKLIEYYEATSDIILDQIHYYNPTIIFSGNLIEKVLDRACGNFKWGNLCVEDNKWKITVCDMIIRGKSFLLVDLYHPSYVWLFHNSEYWFKVLEIIRTYCYAKIKEHIVRSNKE